MNVGLNPNCLQWNLYRGEVFNTPEVVIVRSSEGLGGMSRKLHRLFHDRLIPHTWATDNPPVLLNTWEARYFNVSHDSTVHLARCGREVGVDLLVLDDGWFCNRHDDTGALGDWFPDPIKFPHGLDGLCKEVNSLGMKFGIWLEPEMISKISDLYRLHESWVLRCPDRPVQIGRNQLVLDFSRTAVVEYMFETISELLKSCNIEYVKWDMNRPLTEVHSRRNADGGGLTTQSETSHRYMLGVYALLRRLTQAFPNVLFETCSSGGGRFDPGT